MRFVNRVFLLSFVIAALASSTIGWAQVTTATMYGTVQDPTGAVILGAKVTITNQGTGAAWSTTCNEAGEFAFSALPVGTYTLRIEAAGFKTFVNKGIELAASQVVRQPYTLELGQITETVSVEGSAPLIATASSEQRESLNRLQVAELPLSRRNVSNILRLSTGTEYSGRGVRMSGMGEHSAGVTVDGTDANATPSEGSQMAQYDEVNYIDVVSIEAVQEVQVMRGVMPAEYGGVISGQVNLISKSGTNELHGSAFEVYRSHLFNARNPFQVNRDAATGNMLPKNREVYNQFGGSLGGPIIKNRAFGFGTYEGYRESVFARLTGTVPTASLRQAILAALPFEETRMLMNTLPEPTVPLDANRGRYEGAGQRARSDNTMVLKGDLRVTDYSNLTLTYTRSRPFALSPAYYLNGANDRTATYHQDRFSAQLTAGSSNWVSESRFGYNYADDVRLDKYFTVTDPKKPETVEWQRRVPRLDLLGVGTWGTAEVWIMDGTTTTYDQKVSKHSGAHTVKFGGRLVWNRAYRNNPENPLYSFNNLDDMRANIPGTITISYGQHGPHTSRTYEVGFFAQDDWRVSQKLTLNLGVRYDYYSNCLVRPTGSVDVRIKNLEPPAPGDWPLFKFGAVRPFDKPTENDPWVNLGPRLGFAYKVDQAGKNVVRGAFGTFFAAVPSAVLRQSVANPIVPFRLNWSRAEAQRLGIRYPMYNEDTLPIATKDVADSGRQLVFSLFNPGFETPYSMNYQLNVQRQLAPEFMWEIGYVGVRGVKFPLHRRFNLPDRLTGIRPNPTLIPGGYYVDNSENSTYSSLQTSLRKRFARNFSFDVHYTWGKTMAYGGADVGTYYHSDAETNVQDFFNLAIERGHPDYDVTHRMVADWIYEFPGLASWSAPLRFVLGGWQISGLFTSQTGIPLRITQSCANTWACRADYVGGSMVLDNWQKREISTGCRPGVHCDVQYLNLSAFALVPAVSGVAIRPGNAGTSLVRGPGYWQVDASLSKNFRIQENMRMQFRLDMFNALNKVNLSNPSTGLSTPSTFGRITGARGMRTMQAGLRLTF
jgi:outer membrane receptor protein involved in Fe transport